MGAEPQAGELAPFSLSCRACLDGEFEVKTELPMGQGGFYSDRLKRLEQYPVLIGFRAQTVSWRPCALADDTRHVVSSQCHPRVCMVCKSHLHPKLTAVHSYEYHKKITTWFRDSEGLFSFTCGFAADATSVCVLFCIHLFLLSSSPQSLSKVTCASCFAFSHHVFGEARRGSPAVQDRRSRGALRVRSGHGHVLLRPLGYDQEHLRGRWQVSPVRQLLPGVWNSCERRW